MFCVMPCAAFCCNWYDKTWQLKVKNCVNLLIKNARRLCWWLWLGFAVSIQLFCSSFMRWFDSWFAIHRLFINEVIYNCFFCSYGETPILLFMWCFKTNIHAAVYRYRIKKIMNKTYDILIKSRNCNYFNCIMNCKKYLIFAKPKANREMFDAICFAISQLIYLFLIKNVFIFVSLFVW